MEVPAPSQPYVLLTSPTTVVGVSPGAGEDEVVVTQQSQGVSVYNVQSKACVRSWSLSSSLRLTHAAILQPRAQRLFAVAEDTTVFGWRDSDTHIDLAKTSAATRCTYELTQPLLTMLHTPALLDGICVVCTDGSAHFFAANLRADPAADPAAEGASSCAPVGGSPAPPGDDLALCAELLSLASTRCTLALLTCTKSGDARVVLRTLSGLAQGGLAQGDETVDAGGVHLVSISVMEIAREISFAPSASGSRLCGFCCVAGERGGGVADLALLWSCGQLQIQTLSPDSLEDKVAAGKSHTHSSPYVTLQCTPFITRQFSPKFTSRRSAALSQAGAFGPRTAITRAALGRNARPAPVRAPRTGTPLADDAVRSSGRRHKFDSHGGQGDSRGSDGDEDGEPCCAFSSSVGHALRDAPLSSRRRHG